MFPGFGWGAGAFAIYLVYEATVLRDTHVHHQQKDSHGEDSH